MPNLKYDQEIAAPADDDANVSGRLTRAAQLLGIEYPIIQAPFGGLPSQHLTATYPTWRAAKDGEAPNIHKD
jgi:hypothetical protein